MESDIKVKVLRRIKVGNRIWLRTGWKADGQLLSINAMDWIRLGSTNIRVNCSNQFHSVTRWGKMDGHDSGRGNTKDSRSSQSALTRIALVRAKVNAEIDRGIRLT